MFAWARPLRGATASAPNQGGCATRSAQTVLAQEVDSELQLCRAQGEGKAALKKEPCTRRVVCQ